MADFCMQCTEELFGPDCAENNDMRDIVGHEDDLQGFMATVLCEGCGPIQVNRAGKCLSSDCLKEHK